MTDGFRTAITVSIETTLGSILIELYPNAAPITVSNFLHYIDEGLYDAGNFHRTVTMENQPDNDVKIEVVQGGVDPNRAAELGDPIPLERTTSTKLKHIDGAISMARLSPDSARSDFFICIGDQPELDFGGRRNSDGQGFAAFGRVTNGMDIAKRIQQSTRDEQRLSPPIVIVRFSRVRE